MVSLCTPAWILGLPCLILAFHSNASADLRCQLDTPNLKGMTIPGDVLIGFLFALHLDKIYHKVSFTERPPKTTCTTFYLESFQALQATMFAIEEINNNPNILPNVTLGLQAYDSCNVLQQNVKAALQILTKKCINTAVPNYRCFTDSPLTAVLGPSISTHSMTIAHILGLGRFPQISQWSTSPLLSNRRRFPSFFRTVPSDAFQSHGLAQLVLYFGWSWVGLIAADDDYGQQGIHLISEDIVNAGACVAFSENILMNQPDRNAPHIVNVIKRSTAKVVVAFCNEADLILVLSEWSRQNVSKKILIASEAWSTSKLFSLQKYSSLLTGSIGLAFSSGTLPNFKEFLNKINPFMSVGRDWIKIFWESSFQCTFAHDLNFTSPLETSEGECTGSEKLEEIHNSYTDVSTLRSPYNFYTAVHVVAKALEDLLKCPEEKGPFADANCADKWNFQPWQLLYYMKKVRFKRSNGRELYFDENGDPPAAYDIVNWQLSPEGGTQQVKVGSYDTAAPPAEIFTINISAIVWSIEDHQVPRSVCSESCPPGFRKVAKSGQPVCCHDCVPCPSGEISNQTDLVDCLKCPWDYWPNAHQSRCLSKPIEYLSIEDPLGKTLTAISVISFLVPVALMTLFIQFKATPLVKANNYYISCLLLVSLSLCFLCPLIFIGYPHSENCLLRQIAFGMVFALCISCILAKTIIVIFAFIATMPDSNLRKWAHPKVSYMVITVSSFLQLVLCIVWLCIAPPFPEYNTQAKPGIIIVECNEGSPVAFWTMLGYLFLLASISFIVAFLARRLPDSFNEAQFITFSMLAFLSVWISYIPASLSAEGKYTVAMEIFAILASSWALITCMFFPKCFIILFRPDMNTKEFLMRNYIYKK
ncbi:PREDICTED: extracellular calcium-sensing receptor-like [Nanorana parkeri]|uniref:extracellular calcium-sensing receptor-like n=1 Tax=Nanorana parkeri TaxID=125878 RepID=UPI0008546A2E|nr:PREDICTED: extracellular calcium-sensing receptor-like [Nanorana parkeri]